MSAPIIAVLVPRCSSISALAGLPPIVDTFSLQLAREILARAFRCPWPNQN